MSKVSVNITDSAKIVTTRKDHHCWGCYRKFPPGSKMWRISFLNAEGGGYATVHVCKTCDEVSGRTDCADYDGTRSLWTEGFAIETDRQLWEQVRQEIEGVTE